MRLDSRAAILGGGESGPSVSPGDVDGSLLIQAVRYQGLKIYQLLAFVRNVRGYEKPKEEPANAIMRKLGDVWTLAVSDRGRQSPPTHLLVRGNAATPGDEVHRASPKSLLTANPRLQFRKPRKRVAAD